jgi:hypothetical protein
MAHGPSKGLPPPCRSRPRPFTEWSHCCRQALQQVSSTLAERRCLRAATSGKLSPRVATPGGEHGYRRRCSLCLLSAPPCCRRRCCHTLRSMEKGCRCCLRQWIYEGNYDVSLRCARGTRSTCAVRDVCGSECRQHCLCELCGRACIAGRCRSLRCLSSIQLFFALPVWRRMPQILGFRDPGSFWEVPIRSTPCRGPLGRPLPPPMWCSQLWIPRAPRRRHHACWCCPKHHTL